MRLTMRTNLAIRSLMFCAKNPERIVRKAEIAHHCDASENHLGLVIHKLSQTGFLHTVRGRNGGVTLNRPAQEICVGDLCRQFEGTTPFMEGFEATAGSAELEGLRKLHDVMAHAIEAFYADLDEVFLTDLLADQAERQPQRHLASA